MLSLDLRASGREVDAVDRSSLAPIALSDLGGIVD